MRVGIITYHFSDNFGALLQAYALRKWFVEQGNEVEFINYHPAHVEAGAKIHISLRPQDLKSNIKSIYLKIATFLNKNFGDRNQAARFSHFRLNQLGISTSEVNTHNELTVKASRFDLLVTGSDQVWAPSVQFGFDPTYFLSFAKDLAIRRISYAPSFGRDKLSADELTAVAPLLRMLSSISVRELSGIDIVSSASGKNAVCVPDPTLLHLNYNELLNISTDTSSGHIFCYALRTGDGIRKVAQITSKKLNANIISPYNIHRRWPQIGATVYPGPAEWLSQLRNASFVVTNSFHGTVFSILFQKPFVVVALPGVKASLNARSRNLLAQLGLLDRFIDYDKAEKILAVIQSPIDWESVAAKQTGLRNAGTAFLLEQIAAVSNQRSN